MTQFIYSWIFIIFYFSFITGNNMFIVFFYDSLCRICSGVFRKFVHLKQLFALSIDVEQKPHTLNIQILLLRQKCMQFIIGIKIALHWSHVDRNTL